MPRGFYQFGANNSNALPARQYLGAGLTAFGLVPGRPDDSFGFGLAQTWLNTTPGAANFFHLTDSVFPNPMASFKSSQLMLARYDQRKVRDGCFFPPNLTYIPTPGEGAHTPGALAATFRPIVLFRSRSSGERVSRGFDGAVGASYRLDMVRSESPYSVGSEHHP